MRGSGPGAWIGVAAAAAAALGVGACGGGGNAGAPRLSRADYVRRGNAVCARYDAAIRRLGSPRGVTGIAPYIRDALPIMGRATAGLGRLRPPRELEDEFAGYLDAVRATRRRALDLRAAAARADGAAVQRLLTAAAAAGERNNALARKAGLDACVQD